MLSRLIHITVNIMHYKLRAFILDEYAFIDMHVETSDYLKSHFYGIINNKVSFVLKN